MKGKDWYVPSISMPSGTKGTEPVAMMISFAVTMLFEEPTFTFWGPCTDQYRTASEKVKIFFHNFDIASVNKEIIQFPKSVLETLKMDLICKSNLMFDMLKK